MKKIMMFVVIGLLFFGIQIASAGEKAPQKVYDLAKSELAGYGTDAVIVAAVKDENAKGKTLDQIKSSDEKWKNTAGIDDSMKAMMSNPCAQELNKIADTSPSFVEIFVMDDKGANVCMTDKTSDYWQGDEAKFQKSFADGKGEVFVDDVEFDDSSQTYLVQVSVPVMDGGKAIGAITFGLDIDKIE